MTRYSVDWVDVVLQLLRTDLDGVYVMSRLPDYITESLPLVLIRRVGGDSPQPRFYDTVLMNVQCFCQTGPDQDDQYRAASDLADQVRGILWQAVKTQRVVPGLGWLSGMREQSGPVEISDQDIPVLGRVTATYELRVRPIEVTPV